jgi:hypothetical protein
MPYGRTEILETFSTLTGTSPGIESWITDKTDDEIFLRLGMMDTEPLSKVRLNQLLVLGNEADVSDGFFRYYWLSRPTEHTYDVGSVEDYHDDWSRATDIRSLSQLIWGLTRLYIDALLFFGNIRSGYRFLRTRSYEELAKFFRSKRLDTEAIRARGPALPLSPITRDNRYLISEVACKSYESPVAGASALKAALDEAWADHQTRGGGKVTIGALLDGTYVKASYTSEAQEQLKFAADDMLSSDVGDKQTLDTEFEKVRGVFLTAREAALKNTRLYLSMVSDLDVYVATSMRTREDFRTMARTCDNIFSDARLSGLELRYFDPTMSAASGHEDKGLIECLMVKCAKVLVWCAGDKESWGKDAEAAMALSLGKPVIFYCNAGRENFYRDVHPLTRLIEFDTGVAVGALVTSSEDHVAELLRRIFENRMEYDLDQIKPGKYRLVERLTRTVVRLQTADDLLRETFWNYYGNRPGSDL